MGTVRFGTAGWSYPDWNSTFYGPDAPAHRTPRQGELFAEAPSVAEPRAAAGGAGRRRAGRKREAPLASYARTFRTVEIDSSFYAQPRAAATRRWAEIARASEGALAEREDPERPAEPPDPAGFVFTAKLHQSLTHGSLAYDPHGRGAGAGGGVEGAHGDHLTGRGARENLGNVLDQSFDPRAVDAFREGIEPLRHAGRLGAVLIQFPWSFQPTEAALRYLDRLATALAGLRPVVEVRHAAWAEPEPIARLERAGLGIACIDQPLVQGSLPPLELATSGTAYVRLHGRNRAAWFARDAGRDRRYDYLYSEAELRPWAGRIARLAERADVVYVIANNHFRGQAPANALMLEAMVTGRKARGPAALIRAFPELARFAEPAVEAPASP